MVNCKFTFILLL